MKSMKGTTNVKLYMGLAMAAGLYTAIYATVCISGQCDAFTQFFGVLTGGIAVLTGATAILLSFGSS